MSGPRKYHGTVKMVLFDVDGVLTDGGLHIDSRGEAFKTFNVRDGIAVALLHAHDISAGIISGKTSPALSHRVDQLAMDVSLTGRLDKLVAFRQVLDGQNLGADQVAYVGDDVVDLPLAGRVACFLAPADAHPLVLQRADHVLSSGGGGGAAREAAEWVLLQGGLSLQDAYAPLMDSWESSHVVQ